MPVEEPLAGRIRAEQIAAVMRLSPIALMANIVSAVVIVWAFWDSSGRVLSIAWAAGLVGLSGLGLLNWFQRRGQPKRLHASTRSVRKVTRNACFAAAAWGLAPILLFPHAGGPQFVLVASLLAAVICGGGFALAAVPPAALAYIVVTAAAANIALLATGEPLFFIAGGMLLMYAIMLVSTVLGHSRLLVARLVNESELQRRGEVIGLLLKDFEEHSSDWLWETDESGRLQRVSSRFAQAFMQSLDSLRGQDLLALLGATSPEQGRVDEVQLSLLSRALATRSAFRDAVIPVEVAGQRHWWQLTGKPVFDAGGLFLGYRGVGSDVTSAKQTEARITHLAMHDALTGLPNRAWFRDRLQGVLDGLQPGESVALLFLDLDRFKGVNDTLGHPVGDALLCAVTERLNAHLPLAAIKARLGGDEFAVLTVSRDPAGGAALLASQISDLISAPFKVDVHNIVIGTSIGIAIAPTDGNDPDQLLKNADLALYSAKAAGRGGYAFFEPELDQKAKARRELENDLREAIGRGQLEVFYQPLTGTATGETSGCEALLRWRHPERGLVSPLEFIPLAEETGLIIPIGDWVLHQACSDASRWTGGLKVAVNLSAVQFKDAHLVATVEHALRAACLPAHRLELEITESVLLEEREETLAMLHQLRDLGVRIALDDFGTGYSSLSYLRRFPFDKLKIDRSFIRELTHDQGSQAIVRTIIALASSLGMDTTAEGVETAEQRTLLRLTGCTELQGFLFSPPRERAEFERWLEQDGEKLGRAAA